MVSPESASELSIPEEGDLNESAQGIPAGRSRKDRQREEAIAWGRDHADEVRARQVDKSTMSQRQQKIWKWNRQGAGLS